MADPALCGAIEAAWPGVRVNRLELEIDNRAPGGYGPELAGTLVVTLSVSATAETLLRIGVVTRGMLAAIPPSGSKYWPGVTLNRGSRRVRVTAQWSDPEPEHVADHPGLAIRDKLAPIVSGFLLDRATPREAA